ncbi:MRG-domain-containing protein [Aspergillus caelatus]|uniref:Chromatin modification-related protein EAF3 n=2 Tax=Aspergillus subgen. Circumdati TaxID=2720871 RepID=A0A5N6ZQY6_9EURO|nr:MRG-domain-containing protein [Aspergillus caelatus]KAE8359805.1 MRG-domain-containing protein [Aspergillus caelatus]KAE8415679.1 MRG-domain-containing protein [Aspergillus pseudocaelatus]
MAPAGQTTYQKDERVLCFHHEILYEAKILDVRHVDPDDRKSPYEYLVHYKGWKNTWDDWVPQDRLRKFTEENRELATTLRREAEAAFRQKSTKASAKKRGGSDRSSARGSEERQMSVPGRGTKRARDNDIEKEDSFYVRPSVRIVMPDNLKSLLVDDWENVTKNQQVVALPAKRSVNQILENYSEAEKPKRTSSADLDVLEEIIMGIKEYFDKALDKILLYRFEREQYRNLRKKWESGSGDFADKGPLDIYGAEHLTRLFATMPELIAQTNMDLQSTNRLREELSKFTLWLSKHSSQYFATRYMTASNEYVEKSKGVANPNPGTATSRLV